MRRFLVLLFLFVSTSALAQNAQPPMWRLADEDTTIYLFGTVHVLRPGTEWMTEEVQSALTGSDTLYLEVSLAEQQNMPKLQALVREYGMLPEGERLSDHLPAQEAEALKDALVSLGMTETAVERFKPWFAGSTYSTLRFTELGYSPGSGVEATLGGLAQARGIPISGLETLEYQLSMFDQLSADDTALFVKDLLMDEGELGELMGTLTRSWAEGDLRALDDEINDLGELSPTLAQRLIHDRNRKWAGEIEAMLADPGQVFIAVGSGHFVGGHSVIAYLEAEGLTVERVQ